MVKAQVPSAGGVAAPGEEVEREFSDNEARIRALAASEQRLLDEMQSVLTTTAALTSDVNVTNMLDFITSQARHLTNSEGAAILLLGEDRRQLEVVHSGKLRVGSQLPVHGTLMELTINNHKTYFSNYAASDRKSESICRLLHPAQVGSLLCAPLEVRSNIMGVLLIWNQYEQVFDEHDSRLIHLFADQVALAWHSAILHIQSRDLALERERHRLARDLHDSVSQSLYTIGMTAQASIKNLLDQQADDTLRESLEYIHDLSQTALKEIREHIYNLHPTSLADNKLDEALKKYCDTLHKQYKLNIELSVDANIQLSNYQLENLYYIAREALWNIAKYARDAQATLVLTREANEVLLLVSDKGSGFVLPKSAPEMSGLRGMRERAELLGGSFEMQSKPGRGTQIAVRVPV